MAGRLVEQMDLSFGGETVRDVHTGPPFQKTRTSRAAAAAIAEMAGTVRGEVFSFLEGRGLEGATIEEISIGLELKESTVCGRLSELKKLHLVRHNGQTRLTTRKRSAMVWVAVAVNH